MSTTFTAMWGAQASASPYLLQADWVNLEVVGKLHPVAAMTAVRGWHRRAMGADLGGSAEWPLSAEDALSLQRLSPLEVKSKDCPQARAVACETLAFWIQGSGLGLYFFAAHHVTQLWQGHRAGLFCPHGHPFEKTSWKSCQNGKKGFLSPSPKVCLLPSNWVIT